jgi:8-oxo-dGTP pyrophosphatase MutT (NUDIX family)
MWWDDPVTDARWSALLPDDGWPIEERDAVRVVVLDTDDRILLFRTWHTGHPCHWWELPGGGGEPGETYVDTAIRELHEETGIVAVPAQVSKPTWRRTATFRYRRARRLQHELVVTARLDHRGAEPDVSGQLDYEREDYSSSRWWPVAEVIASRERFYPGRLPEYLAAHLRGDDIDEPFELWS